MSFFSIADIFNQIRKEEGKEGEFLAKTIINITQHNQNAVDIAADVDKNGSIVQKTTEKLNQ